MVTVPSRISLQLRYDDMMGEVAGWGLNVNNQFNHSMRSQASRHIEPAEYEAECMDSLVNWPTTKETR